VEVLGQIGDGFTTGTSINGNGTEVVFNGVATKTQVNSGTLVDWGLSGSGIDAHGSSTSATVIAGGFLFDVGANARDSRTSLLGGTEFVVSGASANSVGIGAGGILEVTGIPGFFSSATNTLIGFGGTEVLNAGGIGGTAGGGSGTSVQGTLWVEA